MQNRHRATAGCSALAAAHSWQIMGAAAGGGRARVHASQELLFPKTYSHIGPYVACAARVKKLADGFRAGVDRLDRALPHRSCRNFIDLKGRAIDSQS